MLPVYLKMGVHKKYFLCININTHFIPSFESDKWRNSFGNKHAQGFAFFLQYWQQPLDIRVPIVVISCLSVPLVAMMFLLQGRISSDFNEEVFALGLTEENQLEQNPRDQVHVQCTFFQCEHKHRKTDLWLCMPAVLNLLTDWLRNLSSGPDPDYKSRALLHPTA